MTREVPPTAPIVLVVEDDPILLKVVQRMLYRMGLRSYGASTPTDALAAIAIQPFIAVVSDIDLPGMSGFVLAEKLRETQESIGVVFMSGRSDHPTSEVLLKPFTLDALAGALGAVGVSITSAA